MVAVVAVVAIALAAIVAVVALGSDDAPAPIATDEIVQAIDDLEALVADARAADEAEGNSLSAGLETCPLGDLDDVWNLASDDLEIAGSGSRPVAQALRFLDDEDEPTSFQCFGGGDEQSARIAGVLVGRASDGSHRRYLRRTLSFADVEFGEEFDHRGGTVLPYCVDGGDSGAFSFCAADWVTDDVQFGVFVSVGENDLGLVEDLLVASLDHLAEQLLANAGEVELLDE
ncbi:MAG: hypothetical protein F2534_10690 [Actinobacteria bacterium]|uniref:Unannotated protein n=1 Tax=freshwater metagenome TaxID=449393 RepID=A0A6J6DS44_9ZZZZ|nr:hypothetical protein [Actinomycetota bacterium]